jgi:hypothetical protein
MEKESSITMAKDVKQRINESLDGATREDMLKCMGWLRSGMRDRSKALQRNVAFALLLMAAFTLVSESPNTQISIGSFQISSGSLVIIFVPALVAYLYLQAISDSTQLDTQQIAFTAALAKWSAKAEQNDLDLLIAPSQALYWSVSASGGYEENRTWLDNLSKWTSNIVLLITMLTVFTFEGWAYYKLYRSPITHDVAWIISACIAFFCLVAGFILFLGDEFFLTKDP